MFRRGGKSWNPSSSNEKSLYSDYVDNDRERDRKKKHAQNQRRVSFKPQGRDERNIRPQKLSIIKSRLRDAADDEEMVEISNNIGYKKDRPKRVSSPVPLKFRNPLGWYQISIPYGQKYEKDVIINNIMNEISPDIFIPLYWKQESGRVVFYIDDIPMGEKLQKLDRKIRMPDGYRLMIKVRNALPQVEIDDALKERMKTVMSKRYNAATKALDLSKFHADPDLKGVFCGLLKSHIMIAAIDIIAENIPDLEALNLNDNYIMNCDSFKYMADKLPNLKILYLDGNKINSPAQLNGLRGLKLVELALKQNPFMKNFRAEKQYVSEMQKKFPKLIKLDGQNLTPVIGFDVMDSSELPAVKPLFFIDPSGAEVIRNFIQQYFAIFDSNDRQPLMNAYHENAMLSLSAATGQPRLAHYAPYCRNLKSNESKIKNRAIRYGKLPAISLLIELPKTRHDLNSFTVDLTLYTPKIIAFNITGVFKEMMDYASSSSSSSTDFEIRSFERSFIIVPWGTGFCIRNELILISNVTANQLKTAFSKPIVETQQSTSTIQTPSTSSAILSTASTSSIPSTSSISSTPGILSTPILDDTIKLQMIQSMAAHSRMNLQWSKKCLEETNWIYDNAIHAFTELQKQNKIPSEAFLK